MGNRLSLSSLLAASVRTEVGLFVPCSSELFSLEAFDGR